MTLPYSEAQFSQINARDNVNETLRLSIFILGFIILWVGFLPFSERNSAINNYEESGRYSFAYIGCIVFFFVNLYLLSVHERGTLSLLFTKPFILLMVWIVISVILSQDKMFSLKRFILFVGCFSFYSTLMLLPKNREKLVLSITIATSIILFLCWFGVIFMPSVSMHHATDSTEMQLAGDWRGIWPHKNTAGPIIACFVFVGIYLLSLKKYVSGAIILGASVIFFLFTGAKTAMMSCLMTIITVYVGINIQIPFIRGIIIFTPALLLNVLGAGQLIVPALQPALHALPIDTSFTGRDITWIYLIERIKENLFVGKGFNYFWESAEIIAAKESKLEEGLWASNGHQSLLDVTVNNGLIGLALFLLWGYYQPFKDLNNALEKGHDKATLTFFTLIWQFSLATAAMESFFLDRLTTGWFTFAISVCALRYLSQFNIDKGVK
jgi:O-antigen ligase